MRLWILSDVHSEFAPFILPDPIPSADVMLVAGDFGVGGVANTLEWLDQHIPPPMEVIIVAGNHDFYDRFLSEAISEARDCAARLARVHFLENESVCIGGVTFVGCTLWTDYLLLENRELAMWEAAKAMNDHRRIKKTREPFAKFNSLGALRAHQKSRRYLVEALASARQPTVVVSHHAPSPMSVPERYQGHRLSPAYASDLEGLIREFQPTLWVHGHIHDRADYSIGKTRVVCNPRGYPGEVSGFDPGMVVSI